MPLREEIVRSLRGALLLARFDPRGVGHFDVTLDGFWRSFVGALLVAPFFIGGMLAEAGDAEIAWLSETFRYLTGWALFPLVMIPMARVMGLSARYVPFVIAYNWMQVVARMTLGVGALTGTGLAILDMLVTYLVLVALPQFL